MTESDDFSSMSEALMAFKGGWPKEEEKCDQTKYWGEVERLMAPYVKNLTAECAQVYLKYIAKTGNTSCPMENIAFTMREILWEAWRRAGISSRAKYEKLDRLPELTPYFVEVVRFINARESIDNHVAYICVNNPRTNDFSWFIAPTKPEKRNPKLATGEHEVIVETLC